MTEEIRKAAMRAIAEKFQLPVYGQRVLQGGKKPCFTVELQEMEQKRLLGRRVERKTIFEIHYFCGEETTVVAEASRVVDGLYEALEIIGGTEKFAVNGMQEEKTADGVKVTAEYTYHVVLTEEKAEPMLRLEYNGRRRNGDEKTDIQQGTAE